MNVRELIEELSTLDPELPVVTFDQEDGWHTVIAANAGPSEYGYYDDADRIGVGAQAVHLWH